MDGTIVDDDAADGVRSTGAGLVPPEEVQGAADDHLSAFGRFASADRRDPINPSSPIAAGLKRGNGFPSHAHLNATDTRKGRAPREAYVRR